jgi:hypothetical protein
MAYFLLKTCMALAHASVKNKPLLIFGITLIALLMMLPNGVRGAFAEGDHCCIHPFVHGTRTSWTSPPGGQIGCLTSCNDYTLYIDFYYCDNQDDDQRITSLTFEVGDGEDESSYSSVSFPVTWEYSYDGSNWIPYSGSGDIDVPFSGESSPGQIDPKEDPHVIVRVTWHVTGDLGDKFYYRVHFTSAYYTAGTPSPGNAGNHYFWYEICNVPGVPEFALGSEVVTGLGMLVMAYAIRRRRIA